MRGPTEKKVGTVSFNLHSLGKDTKSYFICRYLYEMLPPASRPPESEVSPDGAVRLAERITKLRTQAARFRVRYQQFPQVGSLSGRKIVTFL